MEENITKRNTRTVTIVVTGHNINNISGDFLKAVEGEGLMADYVFRIYPLHILIIFQQS